ncbi:hypothetical protein PAXINDRAFT_101156 [Paxillus involutus ATCC 200175]|uniref:Unplaced genomic scaffold PAXINscaffold_40, whole genome shotgun sequence n=1 Tax=Paxillus involutus ATCC 200175 TaxID=664439 RepID=A0A0C9TPT4_PAXIN|nr:hypothetical protein PAXINDRAFT_101156 [Paxillus involutus ATCC 200175]
MSARDVIRICFLVPLPTQRRTKLVPPLTREEKLIACSTRRDHEIRRAWLGPSYPLDLSRLPVLAEDIPLQYSSLKLGYSAPEPDFTLEDCRRIGANVERILKNEKEAARAPSN